MGIQTFAEIEKSSPLHDALKRAFEHENHGAAVKAFTAPNNGKSMNEFYADLTALSEALA